MPTARRRVSHSEKEGTPEEIGVVHKRLIQKQCNVGCKESRMSGGSRRVSLFITSRNGPREVTLLSAWQLSMLIFTTVMQHPARRLKGPGFIYFSGTSFDSYVSFRVSLSCALPSTHSLSWKVCHLQHQPMHQPVVHLFVPICILSRLSTVGHSSHSVLSFPVCLYSLS